MGYHGMGGGGGMSAYLEEQKKRGRKTDAQTVRRVAIAFKPYKLQVVFVLIAILLTTGLGVVNPLLIQRIFDDTIAGSLCLSISSFQLHLQLSILWLVGRLSPTPIPL